jgi:hypothetical protein
VPLSSTFGRYFCGLLSSGMLHYVVGNLMSPDILKECSSFIFNSW